MFLAHNTVLIIIIEDLVNGAEYQFTVVALANLDGANISGSRAMPAYSDASSYTRCV